MGQLNSTLIDSSSNTETSKVIHHLVDQSLYVDMKSLSLYAVLLLILAKVLAIAYHKINLSLTRQKIMTELGCKPILSTYPLKDRLFGIDFVIANVRASRTGLYLEHSRQRFNSLGKTWKTRIFGNTLIQTIDPENLKAVYSTRVDDYVLGNFRSVSFTPLLGNGIFTIDGEDWRHSRTLLRPAFTKQQYANFDVYERHFQELIKQVPLDGKTSIDLQPLLFCLTMDSSTEIIFGKSVNSLIAKPDNDENAAFSAAYEVAKMETFINVQMYPFGQMRNLKEMNAAIKTVHAFIDRFVQMAIEMKQKGDTGKSELKKYSFIYDIANSTNDVVKIRSELLSLLLAGRDTTAALISNMLWLLARRSDVFDKLKGEVNTLNGEMPTYRQLDAMKYLKCFQKESLRVHSVVPLNTRTARVDTLLPRGGGPKGKDPVFVTAGTQIVSSSFALHRDKDIYGDDAEEFRPERWADDFRPLWGFMPFLGGPRVCPGQGLAMAEASYTVVRFMQTINRMEPGDALDSTMWAEDLAITCSNTHGCKVILHA
ncbi:cytochrome protein [Patellaria atrata CBS 101060]|uniref:Cytochrome protein n=1 Tax=Patellaria atrata CBS 101060 TaxID=1346257 RepID=A0A9P4S6H9_9PEZI|nr:cytochrome protein [Patellaria atrata CBS 101060]